ncbi:MAG: hypothetical protein IKQ35_04300 [Bacilli bacterium]|nr:hypothetical protein [Bacilli bacterium]
MYNNNFNSYGNANHFRNSSQIMNSGNIAGINRGPSSVAGIKQNPNNVAGISNHNSSNIAGMKTMDSVVNTNTGPAKQVMNTDGSNMIRNDMNRNNYN